MILPVAIKEPAAGAFGGSFSRVRAGRSSSQEDRPAAQGHRLKASLQAGTPLQDEGDEAIAVDLPGVDDPAGGFTAPLVGAARGEPYQRPEADAVFGSVCSSQAWPSVPIRVVICADDWFFPAEFQRALARDRLGVEADVLPGGHLIALARPPGLAEYLLNV